MSSTSSKLIQLNFKPGIFRESTEYAEKEHGMMLIKLDLEQVNQKILVDMKQEYLIHLMVLQEI